MVSNASDLSRETTSAQNNIFSKDSKLFNSGVKRHTTFVKLVKYFLPVVAFGVMILIILWPQLRPDNLKFSVGFTSQNVIDASDPAMISPRYVGTDKEHQPFAITADLARTLQAKGTKDLDNLVELEMPKADLSVKNGSWLALSADKGLYARSRSELALEGSVILYHDSGYEFLTEKAKVYLDRSIAESNVSIRGQGPFGNVEAQGFRFVEKGKIIYFIGKSKVVMFPGKE